MPRRGRQLIPRGMPRRGEILAACAVTILVAHLLLAQLTLALALVFAVVSKTSRWRPWWLLAPAAAGLAWTLAAGPGSAIAGFTAGPAVILRQLGGGHLAGWTGHPFAGFRGAARWLPRQLPVALIGGAAEAALIGWLDWLHTDEWAVRPPRPGLAAALRRAVTARAIRAGTVVTRQGCALGVVTATGAVAELRWAEVACGALVVGAAHRDVTLGGLQVVHAALRRRKPVIVLDPGDGAIAAALDAACAATGTPLLSGPAAGDAAGDAGPAAHAAQVADAAARGTAAPGASGLWGRGPAREPARESPPGHLAAVEVGRVVRERSAALLPADTAEQAARACTELTSLAEDLRRIGVDGDALVWVPRGERIPAQALAGLLRASPDVGLSVLIGATAATAATELGGLVGTVLIYRVADPGLAAALAPRTGGRLLPRSLAAALAGEHLAAGPPPAVPAGGDPVYLGAAAPASTVAPAVTAAAATDLVPGPVVPPRSLLTLGPAEFVLAANWPRPRLIAPGRMVPARLPRPADRSGRRPEAAR
jgi:hypothetical protein